MDAKGDLSAMDVAGLQALLAQTEARFRVLTEKGAPKHGPEWEAVAGAAGAIRSRLFELTGDWYGNPKIKTQRPSEDDLTARYETPEDIPPEVLAWVRRSSILTSDATDAVRWARIIGTQNHDRYQPGDVTLHRAIGRDDGMLQEIRPGDWVTPDRAYAEDHLRRWLGGKGDILSLTVDGRDVLASPTGNHEEAIYAPYELSAPLSVQNENGRPRPRRRP